MTTSFEKRISFNTQSDDDWFAEAIDITPRGGGGLAKIAGEMHPEISRFLRGLKPDERYQYVLMTPMGAFEYWGMNVNGDVFPEASLGYNHLIRADSRQVAAELERRWLTPHGKSLPAGDWTKFGYKTFEQALRYRHHINKDPTIAYGDIPLAVWNSRMRRVEVIARHDREAAKRVGADEIISDLDEGKPRQISMGCRVKFDVCTSCGNISRTQHDYCDHLRYKMGQVDAEGSVIGAVNFFPVFFDLSDVIVPAGKESGVLMKVAAAAKIPAQYFVHGLMSDQPLNAPNQLIKTASRKLPALIKKARIAKGAEITKKVLPNAGYDVARRLADRDQDLPDDLLEGGDLKKLLTTLALLGIILRPREFQHASTHRLSPDLAHRLRSERRIFPRTAQMTPVSLSAGDFCPHMAMRSCGSIPSRSAFAPHIGARILRISLDKTASHQVAAPLEEADTPLMQKVAQAYAGYRSGVDNIAAPLDVAVRDHFGYYQQHFFGDLLDRALTKTASIAVRASSRDLVEGYLCGAFRDDVHSNRAVLRIGLPSLSPASTLLGT
jgi:hypothetical protein